MQDKMAVTNAAGPHTVTKRFQIDGGPARVYEPDSAKAFDFVEVDASAKKGFVFNYGNDPNWLGRFHRRRNGGSGWECTEVTQHVADGSFELFCCN
jgi:hypothetical protein